MAEMSHGKDSFMKRSQRSFDFHSKSCDQHQYLQEPCHVPYPWDYSHEDLTSSCRPGPSKETNHQVPCAYCENNLKQFSKDAYVEGVNYHPRLCEHEACNFVSNSTRPNRCFSGQKFSKHHRNSSRVTEIVSNEEPYDLHAQTSPIDKCNSSDDQILDKFTESPVTARIPSPASVSSVTSGKRLEWDSGADVGYIFSHDTYPSSNENLSTIERLALVRGCSTALFKRLDPEGISGPPKPISKFPNTSVSFNSPVANSTPLSRNEDLSTKSTKQTVPEVEQVENSVLPGGFLYFHCEQEFENDVAPGEERSSNENKAVANMCKKLSNSLIDLRTDQQESAMSSSLPRSQSVLNLDKEGDKHQTGVKDQFQLLQKSRTIGATCSVSTSSVATIVQKPVIAMTSDKNIQTLPLKLSVGVQVSENLTSLPSARGREIDTINGAENVSENKISNNKTHSNSLGKNSKETTNENNFPKSEGYVCTGAHKKDSLDSVLCASQKIQNPPLSYNFVHNVMSEVLSHVSNKENLEHGTCGETRKVSDREITSSASGSSYTQTGESSSGLSVPHLDTSVLHDGVHGSTGVVGSANSFEYLPGEIFERSFPNSSEAGRTTASPNPSSQTNSSSPVVTDVPKTRHNSESSTLRKSVEEGVVLLKNLIAGKSMNAKTKKKLIQEILNKLVDSDHNEDEAQSRTGSVQSNKHSIISADNPSAVISNVLKQHLGSGDWAEESSRYIPNESSDRSLRESATHSSELRNTSLCSETSQNHRLNSSCTPSGSVSVPGDDEQSRAESSLFSSSNVSKSSRQNWKIPTSRAEKIFQSKREEIGESCSYTPPLLKLCKTEHIKQLEWIKFEINHLTHLKQLLEKQEGITKSLSKLTVQENKLPKLRKDCSKPSHSGKFERNNHQHSNCKTKNRINESGTSYSSGNAEDQNFMERKRKEERNSEDTNKLESPTQSSYILSPPNVSSNKNGIAIVEMKNRRGHVNVFTETFPKSEENRPQISVKSSSYVNSDVSKQRHLETAFKCCCECKKALEAIAQREKQNPMLSQQHVHQFCRCHFMSTRPLSEEKSQDCSEDSSKRNMREFVKHPEVGKTKCKFCNDQENICTHGCVYTCSKHSKEYETTVSRSGSTVENKVTCSDAVVQASIKEPLAYVLTFEPSSYDNMVKRNSLPEIKLMVPPSVNEKKKVCLKKPVITSMNSDSSKENQCPVQSKHTEPEKHNQCVGDTTSEQDQVQQDTKLSDSNKPFSETSKKSSKLTLQEYLKANRPDYIKLADKRSQCLADLAVLRDMRKQKRRELLKMTCIPESTEAKDTSDEKATRISERVTVISERATGTSDKATTTSERATVTSISSKRLFSSRTIREQTRKKYMRTKEVQNKLAERKKKEESRANRLMVELFTKNLQKRALQGIVNHSYSASLSSAG